MGRIGDAGAPVGELTRELAGATMKGNATRSSSGGANYVVGRTMQIPLASGGSSDLTFAVQNPESVPLIIRGVTAVITAAGGSSASINIGIVSSSSKTAVDVISSGDLASLGVVPYIISHRLNDAGSSAITPVPISLWEKNGNSSDSWLTGKIRFDGASSMVGYMLIEVVPLYST